MSQLSGMTGFARVGGEYDNCHWTWELRSVNGKTLDIRLRLPHDLTAIEMSARKLVSANFARGNIQLGLTLQSADDDMQYEVNEILLNRLKAEVSEPLDATTVATLLTVDGVVTKQPVGRNITEQTELRAAILASLEKAVNALKIARDAEGKALESFLNNALSDIETLTHKAEALAALQPEHIRARLLTKLDELIGGEISDERLAQEAALLAMKADVCEETDRLKAHCKQARTHLATGSPIGRKLDFLAQEFNREANTLCSKSADIELTQTGLALKTAIEQFREQAANVE